MKEYFAVSFQFDNFAVRKKSLVALSGKVCFGLIRRRLSCSGLAGPKG